MKDGPAPRTRAVNEHSRSFKVRIEEEGPYWAFSLLKVSASTLTIKNMLAHYAKQTLKFGRYIDMKLRRLSAEIITSGGLVSKDPQMPISYHRGLLPAL